MKCAWKELLAILPPRFRAEADILGREVGQNVRLRLGQPPELNCRDGNHWLSETVTAEDLNYIINAASRYSPWAAETLSKGYITAPGGHRLGICGETVTKAGQPSGFRKYSSVCIRIARDFPGISRDLRDLPGSTLILGAPGWGKTTLLRDLIRQKSDSGHHISVVDEREELFPPGIRPGKCTEVLSGCPKAQGIQMLLRTMEPQMIAMDEITDPEDCLALTQAAWCGVSLIATAHAASLEDYLHREVYSPLVRQNLFENIVILHPDKSWHMERSKGWTSSGSVRY